MTITELKELISEIESLQSKLKKAEEELASVRLDKAIALTKAQFFHAVRDTLKELGEKRREVFLYDHPHAAYQVYGFEGWQELADKLWGEK